MIACGKKKKMEKQTKQKSLQLLWSTHVAFVWIRLLEDIYIVKEIAGKCHTELTDFDRAVRNAAFFLLAGILRLKSQMDFIDLSSCWMFYGCLCFQCRLLLLFSSLLQKRLFVTAEERGRPSASEGHARWRVLTVRPASHIDPAH